MDSQIALERAIVVSKQYVMKMMLLKTISYYEGHIDMAMMTEAIEAGTMVGQAIHNMSLGNFEGIKPPPAKNVTPTPNGIQETQDTTDTSYRLSKLLEERNNQLAMLYKGMDEMRATIDTQMNAINTQFDQISTMINSYQSDMYKLLTEQA